MVKLTETYYEAKLFKLYHFWLFLFVVNCTSYFFLKNLILSSVLHYIGMHHDDTPRRIWGIIHSLNKGVYVGFKEMQ